MCGDVRFSGRPESWEFETRNSSGDEVANVNFLYHDIVHLYNKIQ